MKEAQQMALLTMAHSGRESWRSQSRTPGSCWLLMKNLVLDIEEQHRSTGLWYKDLPGEVVALRSKMLDGFQG